MHFDSFNLHPILTANVKELGFETPTPIQVESIPLVMNGRDVMGLAQTGTGKTAAFMLPILHRFLNQRRNPKYGIRALVVAPTRELAQQIHDAAKELGRGVKFRTAVIYGGVGMHPQINTLRRGVDLVVACPGRLLDHVRQGYIDLSKVETLVLDEADHMFDMGFLPDIRKILDQVPAERQTLLFSATMPSSIRHLAQDILVEPATVRIGNSAPVETVSHAAYPVADHQKTSLLLELLRRNSDSGSFLVFTRTKHRAKRVAEQLEKAGHPATSLQGNLSQSRRQAALDGFRNGSYKVLVATDIAARGIDVTRVGHVINYDIPNTPEAYTHRIGRTGRAERSGEAHSLITGEDRSMIRAIERLLGAPLPHRTLEDFQYAAIAPAAPSKTGYRNKSYRPERRRPQARAS